MLRRMVVLAVALSMSSVALADSLTVTASASGKFHDWDTSAVVDSSYQWMVCGSSDGHHQRGLLKFPTMTELAGKKIDSAVLHMYFGYTDGANPNLPLAVNVSPLQSDWDASTCWNNLPLVLAAVPGASCSLPVNTYGWYTWDTTQIVREWVNGLQSRSLLVMGDEAVVISNPGWQVLKYIAQVSNAGFEPWMEVTYHTPLPGETELAVKAVAGGNINDWEEYVEVDTTYSWMIAGNSDGHIYRGLLKFPVIPEISGKVVDKALLHMNYGYSGGANGALPLTARAYMLESDWDSSTTWASQPAIHPCSGYEGQIAETWLPASANGWNTWDIKEAVQNWANGYSAMSLGIRGDETFYTENPGWQVIKYFMQVNQAGNEPWIEIVYHDAENLPSTISGHITLQNYTGDVTTVPVTFEVRDSGQTTALQTVTLNPNTDGMYNFTTTLKGAHDLFVTASGFTTQTLAIDTTNNVTADVTLAYVLPGDANGDGKVNFSDYLLLAQNFGKSNATWAMGDFNDDKSVNFSDYLLLAQNFGKGGAVSEAEIAQFKAASETLTAQEETQGVQQALPCSALGLAVLSVIGLALYSLSSLREQE